MPAPPDRKEGQLEKQNPEYPLAPLNVNVLWAFSATQNGVDIYWDDPSGLGGHSEWDIIGVNIYRANNSEYGPYEKLNDDPIQATFYRDETENKLVEKEDVSDSFLASGSDSEQNRWIFETSRFPIVKPESEATPANHPTDVTVWIDGEEVIPKGVSGTAGEVELSTAYTYNKQTNEREDPVLPDEDSTVEVSYRYNTNLLKRDHYHRVFYRITTVARREWDGEVRETPLEDSEPKTIHHMENMSYIWEEAIRRNQWILDQGGERVKVFVRKYVGEQCDCYDEDFGNATQTCRLCYGTGIKGGYEGPYEQKMAPMDAEKRVDWSERGIELEQEYDTWTGPSPLLSQRDFIVKQNNDRLVIGGVKMPTNRGNVLQQHFQVSMMSENDIRYEVPVTGTNELTYPETRSELPEDDPKEDRNPQITEKEETVDDLEKRGRTPTYENITS